MTQPATSLDELLRQLGRETSLRGRLRTLGRSWSFLRSLPARDREEVALRVGSEWVWRRLERSFLRDGELSPSEELVKTALERMGDADPTELRKLASMVKRGDREGLKDLMLIGAAEALEDEARELEEGAQDLGEEADQGEEKAASTEAPVEGKAASAKAAVEEPVPATPALPTTPVQAVAGAESVATDRESDPQGSGASATVEVRVQPKPASVQPPSRVPSARLETERIGPGDDSVSAGPSTAVEQLRFLRSLREDPSLAAGLGAEGRARVLDWLGGSWATRRALSQMIRDHALEDLGEALQLISRLGTPTRRAWCLADLIEAWDPDAAARRRIVAAAPTPAARRRLERRASPDRARPEV